MIIPWYLCYQPLSNGIGVHLVNRGIEVATQHSKIAALLGALYLTCVFTRGVARKNDKIKNVCSLIGPSISQYAIFRKF